MYVHVHGNYLHSLEFGTFVLYCFYLNVSKWVIVYVISVFMNVREILECVHVVSTRRPGDTNICVNYPTYGGPMMISLFVTYNLNIMTS